MLLDMQRPFTFGSYMFKLNQHIKIRFTEVILHSLGNKYLLIVSNVIHL